MSRSLHVREAAAGATCDAHGWKNDGLARRVIDEMKARHGKGGLNVCRACLERARRDAMALATAKAAKLLEDQIPKRGPPVKPETTRKLRRRALDSLEAFLAIYAGPHSGRSLPPGHELCSARSCEACAAWRGMVRASRALTRRRHERRRGWRDWAGVP